MPSKPPDDIRRFRKGVHTMAALDHEILVRVGKIATTWPHVEAAMIRLLSGLMGDKLDHVAGSVFRSIINQQARIAVMRDLLDNVFINEGRSPIWRETLDEFSDLNAIRNTYLHSMWVTHEDGRTFLSDPGASHRDPRQSRRVTYKELNAVSARMEALVRRVHIVIAAEIRRDELHPPWLRRSE